MLWIAVAGAAAMALGAFAVSLVTMLRGRRAETAALHSLGLTVRDQGRARAAELVTLMVFAVVAGLVGGTVVALVCVGFFAAAATPGASAPAPVSFGAVSTVAAALSFSAALFAVAAVYVASVQRQARREVPS